MAVVNAVLTTNLSVDGSGERGLDAQSGRVRDVEVVVDKEDGQQGHAEHAGAVEIAVPQQRVPRLNEDEQATGSKHKTV